MKLLTLLLLALFAAGTPVLGQARRPDRDQGDTPASERLSERKAGEQDEGKQDSDAGSPRVNLKNNPRFTKQNQGGTFDDDSAAAPLDQPPVIAPKTVAPPPFDGTPFQGLTEVERLARDGRGPEAAALAEDLAERVAKTTGDEHLQAELAYAAGVSRRLAGERTPAARSFQSAGALAGPGELRLDSLYNSGVEHIEQGEELYHQIPEVQAREMGKGGSMAANGQNTGADTLPQTREEFLAAREALIARLRIDWRDKDSRANLEYVQRRLDDLDRIEAKRDDATTQQKSDDGRESEKTEEGEGADKGSEERDEESEESGDVGSNSQNTDKEQTDTSDPQPGEGAKEGNEDPNPMADPDSNAEQEKQEQQDVGQDDANTESESGGHEADAEMSQEEVKLILDRLNELDERARKLRAALYKTRRIPVDRDW